MGTTVAWTIFSGSGLAAINHNYVIKNETKEKNKPFKRVDDSLDVQQAVGVNNVHFRVQQNTSSNGRDNITTNTSRCCY
jgi:hypothetical protein